ncbi:MAG: hypothetical protein JNK93_16430 [Planctomycetia bacterium]|nr:hypothetical protein [Planctomycetia bacterium]
MTTLSNANGGVCVENGIASFWRGGFMFAEELIPMKPADAKAGVLLATGRLDPLDDWVGVTGSLFIDRVLTVDR